MTRSPSAEPAKTSKRKGGCFPVGQKGREDTLAPTSASQPNIALVRTGTRSVSTLTPSQLARKRANDREAQRAIRARTKEHIERLERELEELKSRHSRDETVQELLKRNKALERELVALRESLGIHGRPYPVPGTRHDGPVPRRLQLTASSARASSFGQNSATPEYSNPSAFGASYLPTPEPCESWQSVGPQVSNTSVPSVVSSPSSSAGNPDEYVPGYIPTSMPSSMMESTSAPPPSIPCLDGSKAEYDDVDSDAGYPQPHVPHPPAYLQQQSWSMYPPTTYYPQSPAL
ncbi:hypothetical protein GQ53DRAFT_673750 [Thozetella sp. PMI_491]|nr:hypothetical protein GQ53DRAFT_673750 [Thozetella sp. PMI_491]